MSKQSCSHIQQSIKAGLKNLRAHNTEKSYQCTHCNPDHTNCSIILYTRLCPSTAGNSPRQIPPTLSVLSYPCPHRSMLSHNVISPTMFWSSNRSYTLYLPRYGSNSLSNIFHSDDVSSAFPFRIGYILDYVCHSGSLPNDGVMDSVFQLDINHFRLHGFGLFQVSFLLLL